MARIRLERHEVEEQALPFVCLRCGRPAQLWKTKRFLLASGGADKLSQIEVALCRAHKNHWLWRGLFGGGVGGVLVALFLAGLAAVSEPEGLPAAWRGPLLVAFGLGVFGLVLWLPVMLALHFTAIRPTRITANDITLAGVSPQFIEQLQQRRGRHSGKGKAQRRERRPREPREGKACPFCAAAIPAYAAACPHCKKNLG